MYISRSLCKRIKLTHHSSQRLRERVGLKTKKKREDFAREVSKKGILLYEIPKNPKFKSFKNYMWKEVVKTKDKDPYCKVYLYKQFFVIVSLTGVIITVINILDQYRTIFDEIYEEFKQNTFK